MLSCECDWCPDAGDTYYTGDGGFKELPFKISKKCKSCGRKIKPGELAFEHCRVKVPEHDVETEIYGEDGEIKRASHWHCETCGDLYESIAELGFCVNMGKSMQDQLKEYHEYVKAKKV